ncbi:hypothetical protein JLA_26 [Enterobacteria phage phiJLA23]|uniref:Uncharacterized protein n=3 Tax=Rogunavirus TaxID=1920866 RepID=A0A0P0IDS6_9CAUD|nr:hypothetical protein FDI75_gp69 [Escherichia phage C119]YP_009784111.1 hypothetical protein HOQ90_gp26 [Enterobacteria phage phiJLA23]AGC35356.1 hypothetical protein JLA_26 [Enterobacteria phage phiJLA23]ALJ98949.1 hypothetical protein C119_69 [Escherichia phage C119]QQM15555.1 hypothetical protein BECP10_00067 [Escherichia phage vB_EcoS-BECP10]
MTKSLGKVRCIVSYNDKKFKTGKSYSILSSPAYGWVKCESEDGCIEMVKDGIDIEFGYFEVFYD